MKKIIILNKKEGETPLEALNAFRKKNKEYEKVSMTYAGRLDPMASGLLLILAGDKTKEKEKYLSLDKEYEFSVIFGFQTDTYDILGKVINSSEKSQKDILPKKELKKSTKENIKHFLGEYNQKYPKYSSKTVNGVPLFMYARSGEEVDIPSRKIHIKKFQLRGVKKISKDKLLLNIEKRIGKIKGDFRQREILKLWRNTLKKNKQKVFYIAKFKINAGSGTYVRVIVNDLGERMGEPTLAFTIKRTRIGKWCKMEV